MSHLTCDHLNGTLLVMNAMEKTNDLSSKNY
jgi:hypothetical protein